MLVLFLEMYRDILDKKKILYFMNVKNECEFFDQSKYIVECILNLSLILTRDIHLTAVKKSQKQNIFI